MTQNQLIDLVRKQFPNISVIEIRSYLNDALDEARDMVVKRGGQEKLDWEYHPDTNMWMITISWMIVDKDD